MKDDVQLGLGLIGIGREWGYTAPEVPPESQVVRLLERALDLGIRYFDTAASYGTSERRFGAFLKSLPASHRAGVTIATKFGEHWDFDKGAPFDDHSYDALRRSLDRSLELLGKVDVLQLHRASAAVLRSDGVARAWEYARSLGIPVLGPSIKEHDAAAIALADPQYGIVQLPYSRDNTAMAAVIDAAAARGIRVAVNRPFAMGKMLYGDAPANKADAFRFVLARPFQGVVLTGTKSPAHLEENITAFQEALLR